jgi:hypothetical protein
MLVDSTISRAEHALAWINIGQTCPIMSISAGARWLMKICSKDWSLGHSLSLSNFHSAVDTDEMPSAGRFFALEFNAPKKGGKAEILRALPQVNIHDPTLVPESRCHHHS